jgi:hypothetical protein
MITRIVLKNHLEKPLAQLAKRWKENRLILKGRMAEPHYRLESYAPM